MALHAKLALHNEFGCVCFLHNRDHQEHNSCCALSEWLFRTNSIVPPDVSKRLLNNKNKKKGSSAYSQQQLGSGMKYLERHSLHPLVSFSTGRAAFRSFPCTPDIEKSLTGGRDGFEWSSTVQKLR